MSAWRDHPKLYGVWNMMRQRCSNPNQIKHKNYGARGIKVCKEWNCPEAFVAWALANGYREGLLIERKNNNKGYNPHNCVWATRKVQARNTTTNKFVTFNNQTLCLADWASQAGIRPQVLQHRLKTLGWPFSKAITEPLHTRGPLP